MWLYLLKKVVIKLVSIFTNFNANGWQKTLELIAEAQKEFSSGASKAAWVREKLMTLFQISLPFVAGLLLEAGVFYAKQKGIIDSD